MDTTKEPEDYLIESLNKKAKNKYKTLDEVFPKEKEFEVVQQALLYAMRSYGNDRYEEGFTDGQENFILTTDN